MYLTPCLIYYIFELDTLLNMTPLDLKCCCNVFDHVFLTKVGQNPLRTKPPPYITPSRHKLFPDKTPLDKTPSS